MKADAERQGSATSTGESKLLVGRFVRRQGSYGTISVVGYLTPTGIEVIADPKKLFGRDGVVETQGIIHMGLNPGDWVEFDTQKNGRFRAPDYKANHLRRLPRFATLHDATVDEYRVLLTKDGWRGDRRPGLWALRISDDKILVGELELQKDGSLRLSKSAAREVKLYHFDQQKISCARFGDDLEPLFVGHPDAAIALYDWSDEADYIGRVIRSLAGHRDSRVDEIITWLELHYEEATGKVSAASSEQDAAFDALRSGALASRLRADRQLMQAYLEAALDNDAVRDAVAQFAREGDTAERERMRQQLADELEKEREERVLAIEAELDSLKADALEALNKEILELAAERQRIEAERESDAKLMLDERLVNLEKMFDSRKSQLDEEIAEKIQTLTETAANIEGVRSELAQVQAEKEEACSELNIIKQEIDRFIAVQDHVSLPSPAARASAILRPTVEIPLYLPNHPVVSAISKRDIINSNTMLSAQGKDSLRSLVVMTLSGELPILAGAEVEDFLCIAAAIICPGRYVAVEADPTLISVEDLWSRPGSGTSTLLAAAADAARSGGTVLVAIKGIEQSGARYWLPALAEALRSGALPRGLLVCCTVRDPDHDELKSIPFGHVFVTLENSLAPNAAIIAPSLFSPPFVNLESLDPPPRPENLSDGNKAILEIGEKISIGLAVRVARMFLEARHFLDDDAEAQRLVLKISKTLTDKFDHITNMRENNA